MHHCKSIYSLVQQLMCYVPNTSHTHTQPCTPHSPVQDMFSGACESENINHEKTVYHWEMSYDGTTFHRILQSTIFTSVNSQILETVYLQPNIFVRCFAQAVDHNGTLGHTRLSSAVFVSMYYGCHGDAELGATLSSYRDFAGLDEVSDLHARDVS